MKSTHRFLALVLTLAVLAPMAAQADVSSVEITERGLIEDGRAFGDAGPYELIAGRITFAVDPAHPRNQVIANLDRAPINADGMVEATGDLRILAPADPERENGVVLVDIANRGRLTALGFNRGASGPYGDGFLMKEGYTVVWVGWEFDVPEGRPQLVVYFVSSFFL